MTAGSFMLLSHNLAKACPSPPSPMHRRFPSALAALRNSPRSASLPIAVIGSGLGGGCAPSDANYSRFFEANPGPTWEVDIREAGKVPLASSSCRPPRERTVTNPDV